MFHVSVSARSPAPAAASPAKDEFVGGVSASSLARTMGMLLHAANNVRSGGVQPSRSSQDVSGTGATGLIWYFSAAGNASVLTPCWDRQASTGLHE